MKDQYSMFIRKILTDSHNAIFSQESADGPTRFASLVSKTIVNYGRAAVLANLSPRQAKDAPLLMIGTFGLRGSISSNSAALSSSLVSRLQAILPGSILFKNDLENEDYTVGAAVIGAHSIGAPHIRQRLYFVADSDESRSQGWGKRRYSRYQLAARPCSMDDQLADSNGSRRELRHRDTPTAGHGQTTAADSGAVELANTDGGHSGTQREQRSWQHGFEPQDGSAGAWADVEWISCRDGKYRPTKPGIHPLAHGIPDRVGLLRGYGNAIVPQAAATFIEAYLEATS